MSNILQPHGLLHTRLPCPTPTPRVYSNSSQLSQWCHPTISSSVDPFPPYLDTVNNAAANMGLQICCQGDSICYGCIRKSRITVGFIFNFFKSHHTIFHVTFPPTVCKSSLFSASSSVFCCFLSFDKSHPNRFEMRSNCCFDLHFPGEQKCWAVYRYLLFICLSSLEKCLSPLPIFNWVISFFLLLSCVRSCMFQY